MSTHLRDAEEEAETLHTNSSHWLDELEMAQDHRFWMQKNLSSLQQESRLLHEIILPPLLYNKTQHQKELQVIERQRQDVNSNLSTVQEQYKSLRKRNILIPRTSDLLMNCTSNDHEPGILIIACL